MRLYVATNRTVACSWYTSCRPIARDYDFIAESLSGKRFIGPCIIKRVSMLDCWASTREKQMDNVETRIIISRDTPSFLYVMLITSP